MLGMSEAGVKQFRDAMPKALSKGLDEFLEAGDHVDKDRSMKSAVFPLGVSTSDVTKIVDMAMNRIAVRVLNEQDSTKMCYPIIPDDCGGTCQKCSMSLDEMTAMTLKAKNILKYASEFSEAIKSFGSNVKLDDYVDLVLFKLTGKEPERIQAKSG